MAIASSSITNRENIFHEITGVASLSRSRNKEPYEVFINHRGSDVKSTLASSIYHFLDGLGVSVFLDREELQLGDFFPKEIEDVMRSSVTHIAIFSKDYARSPYCLEELRFMLETRAPIIPVFYDVQAADLRWPDSQGTYAQAFREHEKKGRYRPETLKKWKDALKRVSYFTGAILRSNDDEGLLLRKIVNRVQQELRNVKVPFEVALYPVGLDDAVDGFEDFIRRSPGGHGKLKIVGIAGMSGCGKTTLARELYNRKYKAFCHSSFLPEVRDSPLPDLQKQLLEDLLHPRDIPYTDESRLKSILAGRFKFLSSSVLIILDEVDCVNQLNALLPAKGSALKSGSMIIITTSNRDVLRSWGISSVYEMTTLDPHYAKELFCWHAFGEPSSPAASEGLVQEYVDACNGLPLLLKVMAGMLSGGNEDKWRSNISKISRLMPSDIKSRLSVSYYSLEEEEQAIFLDVACFFVGEKKNLAIAVWDAAGWSGLENIVNRFLVEIDKQDRIRMHSHLRDFGREIAIKFPPHRLWCPKQIAKITSSMRSIQERTLIRGIMTATTEFVSCSAYEEFPKCCQDSPLPFEEWMDLTFLQLLVVTGEYFSSSDFGKLTKNLVWLRLFDFRDTDLPSWLSVKNLRVLELYGVSRLQELWEKNAHPPKELREMIITATEGSIFHRFPTNISGLEHLKKIALISDHGVEFRFTTLPDEFCYLRSLEHLELRHCKLLSSLPKHFGKLKELRYLDLRSCEMLWKLPESFKLLENLEYLDLSGCIKLVPTPDVFESIRKLKKLYLSGCSPTWRELPLHMKDQKSLSELHLQNTMLKKVPSNISQLRELKTLRIGSPHLRDLPMSLGDLSSLTTLKITGCNKLEFLPPSLERLKLLESLCLEDSEVNSLPEGLMRLTNLKILEIFDCPITELDFSSASSSSMGKLMVMHLKGTKLTKVSICEDCCPRLETLQLEQNGDLVEMEILSVSVKIVKVYECTVLRTVKGIPDLVNLETLEITGCQALDQDTVEAVTKWECSWEFLKAMQSLTQFSSLRIH